MKKPIRLLLLFILIYCNQLYAQRSVIIQTDTENFVHKIISSTSIIIKDGLCIIEETNGSGIISTYDCSEIKKIAFVNNVIDMISQDEIEITYNQRTEVNIKGIIGFKKFTIYNIEGKPCMSGSTNGKIDVSSLKEGIYIVKVGSSTKKILKPI